MDEVKSRLSSLLTVKSLVTMIHTGVFAWLAVTGQISKDFMSIYTLVIAFYFRSQTEP